MNNYKYNDNYLKLLDIEHAMGKYLSEKLSLKIRVQVHVIPPIREGVTVRVSGGERIIFYPYESLLQKDVFMLRVFKDFIFS
jgi:hypothetical protein